MCPGGIICGTHVKLDSTGRHHRRRAPGAHEDTTYAELDRWRPLVMADRAPLPNAGVAVIGGGIAGLAAAHRLSTLMPGQTITLIERDPHLGGKLQTVIIDGFVIEGGPDSFLATKPQAVALCTELGLAGRLHGTDPARAGAFVYHRDRLHPLPEGLSGLVPTRLGPIFRSRLLSPMGKARLALDYALPARRDEHDESLGAFIGRRLGREAFERLVEPLMAGIYAGDGRQLSLAATFPQLRQGEREHGGLIRGVLAARAAGPSSRPDSPRPSAFLAPIDGMGELVRALEGRLRERGVRLLTGRSVTGIADVGGDYVLTLDGRESFRASAVILATPAFAAADLLRGLDPLAASILGQIPHVSTATVSVAYRTEDVPHSLNGYGYVVPRIANRPVLACTWTSRKWRDRAPEGFTLLRAFIGRAGQEAALAGSDDDLVALARTEVRQVLGVTAPPVLARVSRWLQGMPQYTLGHPDRLLTIEERLASHPGLFAAGAAYRGVGIADCIRSGEAAAAAAAAHLRPVVRRDAA